MLVGTDGLLSVCVCVGGGGGGGRSSSRISFSIITP